MRLAVFSDMHGNCVALDAALADMRTRGADAHLCLGDAIQGGPQPAEVLRRLRALGCPVVMGNADAWLLTGEDSGAETIDDERLRRMEAVRQWSLAQLSDTDRAAIAAFQPTVTLGLENLTLLGYHGSPASFDDVILPDIAQEKLAAMLAGHDANLFCGGHTHVQFVRDIGAGAREHFNPGSVGFAYSHHQPDTGFQAAHWAEYAIVDSAAGCRSIEFHRVPFDVAALIDIYRTCGRPHADAAIAQYTGRL